MNQPNQSCGPACQRDWLRQIAKRAMRARGLRTESSHPAQEQLDRTRPAALPSGGDVRDLRHLAWASIDNDDSRDLDQLSVAIPADNGKTKILVAVADVDGLVPNGSAIDGDARQNTTSVYTAAQIFPMLPEKLSTDLTSLADHAERAAIVIEMSVASDGSIGESSIYRAVVTNQAKLAYNGMAAWLDGKAAAPPAVARVNGLDENLRTQDRIARLLRARRHQHGALDFETIEAKPVFDGDNVHDLKVEPRNRAMDLIEDFMVAANGVTARYLQSKGFASMRRVVRTPKRWDRIVAVAASYGGKLPATPDAKALSDFLSQRKAADPLRFPDLSLTIIKLMGRGEYVVELPGEAAPGHFGLAVADYAHSTAPNRRYPDLITQRLLKAAMSNSPPPYRPGELADLASHCSEKEDDAGKVERQVEKSAAAMLLMSRIGQKFDGIVTGASDKGTWVRIFHPPVEGKLVQGAVGVDVGDRLQLKLVHVDVEQGFIDFQRLT